MRWIKTLLLAMATASIDLIMTSLQIKRSTPQEMVLCQTLVMIKRINLQK